MQDQGKRLLIAVGLAMGVMLTWYAIFPPHKDDAPKPAQTTGSNAGSNQAGGSNQPVPVVSPDATSQVGVSTAVEHPAAPTVPRGPEVPITLTNAMFSATFSSYGGVLKSWHLADPRYARDKTHGELLPTLPATGAFGVNFASSTYVLPLASEWTGTKVSEVEVKYTISTPELDVEKDFVVVPEAYLIKATVTVTAKVPEGQGATQILAITSYGFQDPKDDGGGGKSVAARIWQSSTMRDGSVVSTSYEDIAKQPRYEANITWTGYEHPYLLVGVAPKPIENTAVAKHTFAEGTGGLMRTDMIYQPIAFKHGDAPLVRELVGYLGPKNYDQLEGADGPSGFKTGFKATIDLGWFAFIGRPLLWLLLKFFSVVKNWGVAIMLLTILVKGLTIPFTTKSMRSMKAMAGLAPQMKGLQAKYAGDKQRLQMETMALYKQHEVNPLSGCLPILLQMPIWLALYRMLSSAGELYQQPFIPGWIDDLTTSDPFYILPIVLMVTMFAQARLTPANPDPAQKMQQRMMQYGMPLMFGVMSFFFPAGLTLYIFTNTCLSALHSIYMNKFDKKSLEIVARMKKAQEASEAAAAAKAAKTAKDANPTKSKVVDDDSGDDDGGGNDAAPGATNGSPPRAGQARPRRNKKGRKR